MRKNIYLKKSSYLLGLTLLLASSCTDKFEEYNTNKYEVTEDMASQDNLKTGSFFAQMQRNVVMFKDGSNEYSDYQVAQGLTSDLYSNYVAPTGTWRGGVHNGSYSFVDGWYDQTFTKSYTNVMMPFSKLKEVAEEQNLPEVVALATIVKVEAMHRVADAYGSIPYCNYGNGSLASTYDKLEDIYKKFFEELDGAIATLTDYVSANPSGTLMKKYDYVYSGNVENWIRFANTLRMRLAMRVVYADAALAQQEAEKSVNSTIGFIDASSQRAVVGNGNFTSLTYYHPIYECAYNFNDGELRMSASMDSYMNGYSDPRLSKYFVAASDGKYHGVRLGIVTSVWKPYVSENISNFNMSTNTHITWMTASESYFLRAEGALRGWNMGGTAKEFYEKAVAMSFEENGAGDASSYLADATSKPVRFTDNSGASADYSIDASSDITIAWDETATTEKKLERIITQKWIALYPDGPEGWAEFRRTGYPKLFPVVTNNSNGTINTDTQVRRIPFPVDEYNNDYQGVLTGIQALGGSDNGGTKLWWDKK